MVPIRDSLQPYPFFDRSGSFGLSSVHSTGAVAIEPEKEDRDVTRISKKCRTWSPQRRRSIRRLRSIVFCLASTTFQTAVVNGSGIIGRPLERGERPSLEHRASWCRHFLDWEAAKEIRRKRLVRVALAVLGRARLNAKDARAVERIRRTVTCSSGGNAMIARALVW